MAWEWILSMLGSGAVAAALLGVAGYLGRAQLAHWLNRDIEAIKARHSRDLEAYKVGLIAEAERTKATQEIRKAIALLMAEKKYNALNGLHRAAMQLGPEALSLLWAMSPAKNTAGLARMEQRMSEYRQAVREAGLFFEGDELVHFYDLNNILQGTLALASTLDTRPLPKDLEGQEAGVFSKQKEVDEILHRRLHAMLAMAD